MEKLSYGKIFYDVIINHKNSKNYKFIIFRIFLNMINMVYRPLDKICLKINKFQVRLNHKLTSLYIRLEKLEVE